MNLFYNPTLTELHALVEQGNDQVDINNYKVVVDNDGEVIVDFEAVLPESKLSRFKFYFKGLHDVFGPGFKKVKNLKFLNQLYKNLVFCWEKGISGPVDFQEISKLQNILYHKEISSMMKNDYPISINTYR